MTQKNSILISTMGRENPKWHEFRELLKEATFSPSPDEALSVPDIRLLDEVAEAMKRKILTSYGDPTEQPAQPGQLISLETRFRDAAPDDFPGTLHAITIRISPPNLAFINRMDHSEQVDPASVIQFSVEAQAHLSGHGDIGDVTRQFIMLARTIDGNHAISLLSGRSGGTAGDRFKQIVKKARTNLDRRDRNHIKNPTLRGFSGRSTG